MRTINKQPKQPAFIFSVYQDSQDNATNLMAHAKLVSQLNSRKISFKEVDGVYTYANGVKTAEKSVYIQPNMFTDINMLKDLVERECHGANQESYLSLDADRQTLLVPTDAKGQVVKLGKLTAVNEHEAKASEAYTYDSSTNTYFICK